MTKKQAIRAVRAYTANAWPVASKTSDGCLRKAWAESHLPNVGLELFRELMANEGFVPRQYGGVDGPWIMKLPGPNKQLAAGMLKCQGV